VFTFRRAKSGVFMIVTLYLICDFLTYHDYIWSFFLLFSSFFFTKFFCIRNKVTSGLLALSLYFLFLWPLWAPHLEMSPKRFTKATIALFSASVQTHCALVVCDSKWVTVALHRAFWKSAKAVTPLQRCLALTWLVPRGTAAVSTHVLCTPYNRSPFYSVTTLKPPR